MLATDTPFRQYFDTDGSPLDGGSLYFGQANQNPETAPVAVFWDAAGTQPAAQPIRTLNGYPMRTGTPATIYTAGNYSTNVRNSKGELVCYAPDAASASNDLSFQTRLDDFASSTNAAKGAALVGFGRDLAYPANTVGRSLRAVRNVLEAGTIDATGVTPCSAALSTMIAAGGEFTFPAGTYLFDSSVTLPDNTTLRFQAGAIIKPAANNLTLFVSKDYSGTKHSYFTQIHSPYFDANGKTGVVCFDLYGLRHAAGIFFPKFIGAFNHCIKLTELCWDCIIDEPFAQGCVNGILIAHGSNAVQVRKPGIDGLGSAGYGIKIIGGATYPSTSNSVIGGYVQGFSGAGGVGIWDGGSGTTVGVYGSRFDTVYFELNDFADIYYDKSYYSTAVSCQHYVTSGQNANYGRNCDGVRILSPLMTSGARSVGLYNFDTSNVNCYGDQTASSGTGINLPLGTVSGIGSVPYEEGGDFPSPGVVVESSAGASTGITYVTRVAKWHRIGKRVNLTAQVKWTGWTGPAGNIIIKGAPVSVTPSSYTPTGVGVVIGLMAWTGASLFCYLNGTGTNVAVVQNSNAGGFTPLPMAAAGELTIDLSYTL